MAEPILQVPMPWFDKSGPGARRVAALMLGLGQELATELFKKLNDTEVRQVALGAKELKREGPEAVPTAFTSFIAQMQDAGADALGGDEVLRRIATDALGPDAVKRTFDAM